MRNGTNAVENVRTKLHEVLYQERLHDAVKELFPTENIFFNARKEPKLKDPVTGNSLELDVWIPNLKLCFEFQDAYHYATIFYTQKSLEVVKQRDLIKHRMVGERGESLITVPCWWDGKLESLVASIRTLRPELLKERASTSAPISTIPPVDFFKPETVPLVGELMIATFPPMEFTYTISTMHPWWLSEKYDGVRCCWNFKRDALYARSGAEITLANNILMLFPKTMLDSEAWFGRGRFNESRHLVRPSAMLNLSYFRIVVFDDPAPEQHTNPFEKRYASLLSATNQMHPFIVVAAQFKCTNRKQLTKSIQFAIEKGAEGIIARKARSFYEHGKSLSLVKLKATRDKEALVVKTSLESITLQMPEGLQFNVAREFVKRRVHPIAGDVVTFSYRNFVNSLPVFAIVEKIRTDVSWPDVIRSHARHASSSNVLSDISTQIITSAPKTYGAYVHAKRKKIRKYFESIAREKGIDPLVPEDWYSFSPDNFRGFKGAMSLISLFGSVVNALTYLFPEIGLDPFKFEHFYYSFWNKVENRRAFFEQIAQAKDFDPLLADNWYPYTLANINNKRAREILRSYYDSSLPKALVHLFPDVEFTKRKFSQLPRNYYTKLIFDKFAKTQSFDPLVAHNWYAWSQGSFMKQCKRAEAALIGFKTFQDALSASYPDIGLDFSVHSRKRANYWNNPENRKLFFDKFAKKLKFDPLVPENWLGVTRETVVQNGGSRALKYYQNLQDALTQVYPNIGLDFSREAKNESRKQKALFDLFAKKCGFNPQNPNNWYSVSHERLENFLGGNEIVSSYGGFANALQHLYPNFNQNRKFKNFWSNEQHRKEFFIEFAKSKNFNPLIPENWYTVSYWDIQNQKKAASVLRYYKGDFKVALQQLFPSIGLDTLKFV